MFCNTLIKTKRIHSANETFALFALETFHYVLDFFCFHDTFFFSTLLLFQEFPYILSFFSFSLCFLLHIAFSIKQFCYIIFFKFRFGLFVLFWPSILPCIFGEFINILLLSDVQVTLTIFFWKRKDNEY